MSSPLPEHLTELGRALNHAMRADVAAEQPSLSRHRHARWLRNPRRAAIGVVAAAVAIPATAFAATQLMTTNQVATSLSQGSQALAATHATCTVVRQNVEYHCVTSAPPTSFDTSAGTTRVQMARVLDKLGGLSSLPAGGFVIVYYGNEHRTIHAKNGAPVELRPARTRVPVTDWNGATEITVDTTKHVNGGCRSLNTEGTGWQCYLGQAAVQQNIISPTLLGQYAPEPSVG